MDRSSLVEDEFPVLECRDVPLWGENYVVTFHDPESGVGSLLSLGRWVIRNDLWRNMSYFSLPNDRVLISRNYGRAHDPKIPDSNVFRIEILEAGRKLRYVFEGPMEEHSLTRLNTIGYVPEQTEYVRADLIFESDDPIWDMHAKLDDAHQTNTAQANFNSPDGHIEQNGRLTGALTRQNGQSYKIEGKATRDHSRGVRDLTNYKGHIWNNAMFPSGKSIHHFSMKTHGYAGVAAGRAAAIVDGKLYEIRLREDTNGWLDRPSQLFEPTVFTFDSDTLGTIELIAEHFINSVPLLLMTPADHHWTVPSQSVNRNCNWVNEQKARYRWDGEIGYGHCERGNSSFDPAGSEWQSVFRDRAAVR